ncbi:Serine-threonine/tyrosine-protein kinase, catalytic domain [Dillenia turbinata]|uniref:non-specific serine/threonine protein kinase n=1 Tax=Dillenia turbinata TaxID=194707 RepID=A0AAN8VRL4_9MAGN
MLLLLLLSIFLSLSPHSLSVNQEGTVLLQVKSSFDDPNGFLSNWNPSHQTPCNWAGVSCDKLSQSVTSIDLTDASVAGPFPLLLCSLQNLTNLVLFNNNINASLPPNISTCHNLQLLDVGQNLLTGELPETLADLPNLVYLDFQANNFSGNIPESFGRFPKLEVLSLTGNLLNGVVPGFLGNISSLKQLNISYNPFTPSRIPPEFGNLTNLEILWLTQCNLVGQIPDVFGKLKNLQDFDVAVNNLEGPIPSFITELTSIVQIELYNNSLSGVFPSGWSKLTALRNLDASMNRLSGKIPDELLGLPLASLNLYENQFEGNLSESLVNSPNLFELRLFQNKLTGQLPRDLGKNSPLTWVDVSNNEFSGELPENLCANGQLLELLMIYNSFSGKVPEKLSECRSLTRIRLGNNQFSGEIPAGLWGLPHVSLLELVGNSFSGQISSSIGGASNLSLLIIAQNNFSGLIPEEIGMLGNLYEFSGSDNQLSGLLPRSIVNLPQLGTLDLHNNKLSGEIPPGIQAWKKLNDLNLANNAFSGSIPAEIGRLSVLNYLDLSRNQFTGKIPLELQNLKLNLFNLSYNRLSGDLPPLFAKEAYKSSFLGNPGLCGDLEGLCPSKGDSKRGYVWLLRSIFALAGIVLIVGVVWFYLRYRNFKKSTGAVDKSKWTLMSFHKLAFSEFEILDSLDEDNVIGSGSSGKVYKAVLNNGEAVAVKKLWGGSNKANESEDIERGQGKDDGFEAETFEYAYTLRVNEKSDIYSFGVVLLELVTGKRPVDPEFGEKDLVKWVASTIDQKGVDHVLDPKLDSCFKEEICKVLNIGLLCTSPLPINRPSMRRVVKALQEIGGENQLKAMKKDGKLSPYYYEDASDPGNTSNYCIKTTLDLFLDGDSTPANIQSGKENLLNMISYGTYIAYGIVMALLSTSLVILTILLLIFCRKLSVESEETLPIKVCACSFNINEIDASTDGFNPRRIIGKGRLGTVYTGVLSRGELVAIKRIHPSLVLSNAGLGFSTTIKSLSFAHHPNIVPIMGFSQAPGERIVVMEFVGTMNLDFYLHQNCEGASLLDWNKRIKIAAEVARGLEYLHEGMAPNVVHGGIKSTKILIDAKFCARICDYGVSNFLATKEKRGLVGYVDDEYWVGRGGGGGASKESDVYGFGVILLEILSGRRCEEGLLVKWSLPLIKEVRFSELLDRRLVLPSDLRPLVRLAKVALACVGNCRKTRPSIVHVATILNNLELELRY